jgi:ABC-type amino acid transport substrate-binding protein
VAFTVPHYITGARMLVRADSTLSELRAFTGKKVASTTGTTPLHMIRRADRTHLHRLEIVEVRDHAVGVDMVARGEVDAFVMDEVLLYGLIAAHPDAERLKVVGRYITIEPLAIMLPPDDPDFKAVVDQGMKQLIRSQEAHRLHDRWFVEKIPPLDRSLNLPMNDLLKAFWKFPTDWVPN